MNAPLHLGILKTDAVLEAFQPDHGDYPEMFQQVFSAVQPDLRFTVYDVRDAVPEDVVCDAYVITGSRASVYDDEPWIPRLVKFVADAMDVGARIIGVCFGHQLMAHGFGGRVEAAPGGWAVGVHAARLVSHEPWMGASPPDTFALLSSHKDQVVELPPGARLYATAPFCPVAGFTLDDRAITVQGHPEFRKDYSRALMDRRRELLGEAVYQQGVASLSYDTDELRLARWLLDFAAGSRG